jgi:hypothetical protein
MSFDVEQHKLFWFYEWSRQKIKDYWKLYPDEFRADPSAPPRKGIAPGQEYPLSLVKYEAAVWSVAYGAKLGKITLQNILGLIDQAPSLGLFRVWRTQKRFKSLVGELKGEFARCIAENILYGDEDYSLDVWGMPMPGLFQKIWFMQEAINYSPDLQERICDKMANSISLKTKNRSLSDYLGHHIWCILMLYAPKHFGKKSRQRAIFLDVCKKIIGRHWRDNFLRDYLSENTPPDGTTTSVEKWRNRFKYCANDSDAYLERGNFDYLQDYYREELAAIVNSELLKLSESKNTVELKDLTVAINFLANKYHFYTSQF